MKLVVLDGHALNPGDLSYACLEEFGEVTVYERTYTQEEAIARIGDSEIVLLNKVPITQEILDRCPNIRLICVQGTGYNVIDIDACAKRGIPVTNVPTYGTETVAQFTMALLLELCHRIGLHNQDVHQGGWQKADCFTYWLTPQVELAGKTMGIIGLGSIGMAVARLAKAFGMNILAFNRSQSPQGREIATYVDLDTLLSQSDVVSLHCPLFPETQGIINARTLSKMRDGALLVNTARGALINEQDLAQALTSGKLRGAAMDVTCQEPIEPDNPLLSCKNCIIPPHMAWAPLESRQRLLNTIVDSIRGFLNRTPKNVVNGL